ncbi:hypothetical protein SteCoe_17150 [Stentor coeruleus]|uniref:Uncharacterized protein n=1 Tax=Stentor coeruleus TaxID=5963 RepID=A0A1R2BZJ1_9CILI|nr:hypothetical protein SteCoe_17150 [Stentor coeruleus]
MMYLSTITEKDAKPKSKLFMKPGCSYLETADIQGASPSLKGYEYFNKPSYSNTTDLIEKAQPSHLHHPLNRPEYNLNARDIDKAYPTKTGFQTKRIGTNPLDPKYQLSHFEVKPVTPPKFIRDQIGVSDIEGTRPNMYSKWATRNTMSLNDIDGAHPRPEKNIKKPDFMDPRDINKGESHTYNRNTNPLMPEYLSRDEDGKLISIGYVDGSKPKASVNTINPPHKRHLDNQDIEGSTTGTVGLGAVGKKERNYEKKLATTADIEGAQSGSLKKGITTVRQTNPLDPNYMWKTEDTPPKVHNKIEEKDIQEPKYVKSAARFWGVTPAVSETKSPPRSHTSSRQSDFHRNANKFYDPASPTDKTLEKDFQKNAQKFYENPKGNPVGINYFQTLNAPGSINKSKPKSQFIDPESLDYQKNANNFFLVSQSRPQSNGSNDEGNSEYKFNAARFYGAKTPQDSASKFDKAKADFYEPGNGPYKFNLSRAEIGKPGKPPINPTEQVFKNNSSKFYGATPPVTSNSQRNLLSEAAKTFFTGAPTSL